MIDIPDAIPDDVAESPPPSSGDTFLPGALPIDHKRVMDAVQTVLAPCRAMDPRTKIIWDYSDDRLVAARLIARAVLNHVVLAEQAAKKKPAAKKQKTMFGDPEPAAAPDTEPAPF